MDKFLIFSDLDGTALNSDHEFSHKLKSTVAKVFSNGSYFIPVTARSTSDALKQAKILGLDKLGGLVAANNGAQIYDFKTKKFIADFRLDKQFLKNIFDFTYKNFKYKVHYFADDATYVYGHGDNSAYWSKVMDVNYHIVQSFEEIDKPISHLTIILEKTATDKQAEDFYSGFKKYYPDIAIVKYTNRVFEVTTKGIDKGYAVTCIKKYLKLNDATTYAFGDSHNDFPLFAKVDISVAMGNAISQLMDVAVVTTTSNDRDGVAKFINEQVLKHVKGDK